MTEQITDVDPTPASRSSRRRTRRPCPTAARSASPPRARPHPEPRQYVLIAVVLVVITGFEVATSYLEGDVNSNLIIVALGRDGGREVLPRRRLVHAPAHRQQDLRRFFLLGLIAAPILYTIVLLMFHAFDSSV